MHFPFFLQFFSMDLSKIWLLDEQMSKTVDISLSIWYYMYINVAKTRSSPLAGGRLSVFKNKTGGIIQWLLKSSK